jgi:uncharacterized membrane protein YtjA (UPF0391 family)
MFKIHLIPEWRDVVKKAWSMRFMIIAGIASAVELIVALYFQSIVPKGIFIVISLIATALGMFSRVVAQKDLDE